MELTVTDRRALRFLDPGCPLLKLAGGFRFTEGPVYTRGELLFTDFYNDKIYRYKDGLTSLVTANSYRTVGMTLLSDGRVVGCATNLHAIADIRDFSVIADHYRGVRLNGTNDVIGDSRGRIFFSDPASRPIEGENLGYGGVYMLSGGELTLLERGLPWPNGLALSPDEKFLYIVDSRESAVYRRDMASGDMERFAWIDPALGAGVPDGMRVDPEGNLFVAGPGGISVISPEGAHMAHIGTPEIAANLCFGEGGLFITASTGIYFLKLAAR